MAKQTLGNWALFILLSVVWGSSFILMKISTKHLTGWQVGSTRILAAGLVFLPFAIFHITKIPLRKLPMVVVSGFLGNLFPAFLFATAIEKNNNSAVAAILNSLTPLFVVLFGVLFFKARVHAKKVAGVLIGFAGLLALTLLKSSISVDDLGSMLLILVATICYGITINLVGHYLKDVDAIHIATVSMAIIAIPAGIITARQHVFSMLEYDDAARWSIAATILLGIAGSANATALFYLLIQRAGGLFASLVTYAIPVVAIFWGLLAGEQITGVQVACLMLILGGVYLANKEGTIEQGTRNN